MTYLTNSSICIVLCLTFFIYGCSDPLQQKYNPQTFSEDLDNLGEFDREIIKNVINAYVKNSGVNSIAGSETIMIPSLTFEQIKSNYISYHQSWREAKKLVFIDELKERWALEINPKILNKYLGLTLKGEKFKNPENGIISRKLFLENKFEEPFSLIGAIITNKKTRAQSNLSLYYTEMRAGYVMKDIDLLNEENKNLIKYIEPGNRISTFINDYEFSQSFKPKGDMELEITEFGGGAGLPFTFVVGEVIYSIADFDFLSKYGDDSNVKDKIDSDFKLVSELIDSVFTPQIWPYSTSTVSTLEQKIRGDNRFNIVLN